MISIYSTFPTIAELPLQLTTISSPPHHSSSFPTPSTRRETAYGYLQSNFYQNPELYHESVAHFSTAMGKALFIPKTPAPSSTPATVIHSPRTAFTPNHSLHPHSRHGHDHADSDDHPCGHAHEDELTAIESLYPQFDPKSAQFSLNYDTTINNTALPTPQPRLVPQVDEDKDIVYIGNDSNIFHIKVLITGDQNAGKSTFLHALTHSHDPSYLLLNRYLPILQASFYNARIISRERESLCDVETNVETNGAELFRDEYPFIDTDIGVTQLFLTFDDLWLFLEDVCGSDAIPPQFIKPSEISNITTPLGEDEVILAPKFMEERPLVMPFGLPDDNVSSANVDHMEDSASGLQNEHHAEKGQDDAGNDEILPFFSTLYYAAKNYPHVCLEFVEVGGDHLDRIASYLLDQFEASKTTCQVDSDQSPPLVARSTSSEESTDVFGSADDMMHDDRHDKQSQSELDRFSKDKTASLLSGVCQLYHQFSPKRTDLRCSQQVQNQTAPPQTPHQRPQDTDNESVQTLLRRTLNLMQPQSHELSTTLSTPLSYFVNLTTLIHFSPQCQPLRCSEAHIPQQPSSQCDSQTQQICAEFDNSTISLPIHPVNQQQYVIITLRMCLLILIQFQSQQLRNAPKLSSNDEPPVFNLQTLLLRAPIQTYNVFREPVKSDHTPQFTSPFHAHLRAKMTETTRDGAQSAQPRTPSAPHFTLSSSSLASPQLLFNTGELELPIDPLIHISPSHFLQSLFHFFSTLYPTATPMIYSSILEGEPLGHITVGNKIDPILTAFLSSFFLTIHQLYGGYPAFTISRSSDCTNQQQSFPATTQLPHITEFSTFFDAFITTHINNFFEEFTALTCINPFLPVPDFAPFFPYIDVTSKFATHTFVKHKNTSHKPQSVMRPPPDRDGDVPPSTPPQSTLNPATPPNNSHTRVEDISTDPGAVLCTITSMIEQYCNVLRAAK